MANIFDDILSGNAGADIAPVPEDAPGPSAVALGESKAGQALYDVAQKEIAGNAGGGRMAAMGESLSPEAAPLMDAVEAGEPRTNMMGGLRDIGKMIYDIPIQTKGAFGQATEDRDPRERITASDVMREEAEARTKQREGELTPEQRKERILPFKIPFMEEHLTRGDIADTSKSTGFSAVAMGAGLGGMAAAAPIPVPGARIAGGMLASGKAAFNMDRASFTEELFKSVEKQMGKGHVLTPDERKALISMHDSDIFRHAMWEAGPEAAGNVLGVIPGLKNLAKGVGTKGLKKLGKAVAELYGMEMATETVTQTGQQRAESRLGMSPEKERSWTSAEDWNKSFQEIAPQTFILTSMMGGGATTKGLVTPEEMAVGDQAKRGETRTGKAKTEEQRKRVAATAKLRKENLKTEELSEIRDNRHLQEQFGVDGAGVDSLLKERAADNIRAKEYLDTIPDQDAGPLTRSGKTDVNQKWAESVQELQGKRQGRESRELEKEAIENEAESPEKAVSPEKEQKKREKAVEKKQAAAQGMSTEEVEQTDKVIDLLINPETSEEQNKPARIKAAEAYLENPDVSDEQKKRFKNSGVLDILGLKKDDYQLAGEEPLAESWTKQEAAANRRNRAANKPKEEVTGAKEEQQAGQEEAQAEEGSKKTTGDALQEQGKGEIEFKDVPAEKETKGDIEFKEIKDGNGKGPRRVESAVEEGKTPGGTVLEGGSRGKDEADKVVRETQGQEQKEREKNDDVVVADTVKESEAVSAARSEVEKATAAHDKIQKSGDPTGLGDAYDAMVASEEKLKSVAASEPVTVDNKASVVDGQKIQDTPTEGQKEKGNYLKPTTKLDGLDVTIENAAGTERSGKDDGGREWNQKLENDYGYIKGTVGFDKDHVDVFYSGGYKGGAKEVYVVNQYKPDGSFDEHKVVIGAKNRREAMATYKANYEKGWKGGKGVVAMSMEEFKTWVKSSEPKKGPAAPQKGAIAPQKGAPKLSRAKKTRRQRTIQEAFPGAKVSKVTEGYAVELPEGRFILVKEDGNLHVNTKAGVMPVGGSWRKLSDKDGLMRLSKGAGPTIIKHEVYHAAEDLVLTDREVNFLRKKYGNKEQRADAYSMWDGTAKEPIFEKIKNFFKKIANALGSDFDMTESEANKIFNDLYSGKIWERKFNRFGAGILNVGDVGSKIHYALDKLRWDVDQNRDIFGSVNNRLGNELAMFERLFGISDKAMMAPGVLDGNKRPLTRTIKAYDMGLEIQRVIDSGLYDKVMKDKRSNEEMAAAQKGLSKVERGYYLDDLNVLRGKEGYLSDKEDGEILGDNSKAGRGIDFVLGTCQPTENCQVCYAATAFFRMSHVRKSMRNTFEIKTDPIGFAERTAKEVLAIPMNKMNFLRLQGSGDLTSTEQIESYNHMSKLLDRPIQIFSRHHANLAKLKSNKNSPFFLMGSVDTALIKEYGMEKLKTNMSKHGIANAVLFTDESEIPNLIELSEAESLGLILSAKEELHKSLRKHPKLIEKSCPCDAMERTHHGSCRQCALSGSGCFTTFGDIAIAKDGTVLRMGDKGSENAFPIVNFASHPDFNREQSYLEAFNYIIDSSITMIKGNMRALNAHKNQVANPKKKVKGAKKTSIVLKDLRFPGDTTRLYDTGNPYGIRLDPKQNNVESDNPGLLAEMYIRELEAQKALAKEGTFYLPGGEIQPALAWKDWKQLGAAGIMSKQAVQEEFTDRAIAEDQARRGPQADTMMLRGMGWNPENQGMTQVPNTVATYKKYAKLFKKLGFTKVLDYASGLGKGTKLFGKGTKSYEPFPKKGVRPTFTKKGQVKGKYQGVINLNTLNVLPWDTRQEVIKHIGSLISKFAPKDGTSGAAVIQARDRGFLKALKDPKWENKKTGEVLTSAMTYQKGYTQQELVDEVQGVLGEDFVVKALKNPKVSGVAVSITHKGVKKEKLPKFSVSAPTNGLSEIKKKWSDKGVKLFVSESNSGVRIDTIIVPKEGQKQGIGTAVMNDITAYADNAGKTVFVTPAIKDDFHGTTSQARLKRFYKRFGFVENKGRNKDFAINARDMYREPAETKKSKSTSTVTNPADTAGELEAKLGKKGLAALIKKGALRIINSTQMDNILAKALGPQFSISLLHGSGTSGIDKFDLALAGSNDGTAYGHGIYLTDSKAVARFYAERESGQKDGSGRSPLRKKGKRNIYKADVAGKNFVGWENISPEQKAELIAHAKKQEPGYADMMEMVIGMSNDGGSVYRDIAGILGGETQASQFFLDAGIDGITYPAGLITGKKQKGTNYVVFDQNAINITDSIRYSKDGEIEGFTMPDGTVYMVDGNIQKGQAMPVLTHELGVHAKQLGFTDTKQFQNILNMVEKRAKGTSDESKAIRDAQDRIPEDTGLMEGEVYADLSPARKAQVDQVRREETLAYLITNSPEIGIVRRLYAAIVKFLVEKGIVTENALKNVDLQALALSVVKREAAGTSRTQRAFRDVGEFAQAATMSVAEAADKIKGMANFKKWFEGSQVVDEAGKPKVVYHGTNEAGFRTFDLDLAKSSGGIHFADSNYWAKSYVTEGTGDAVELPSPEEVFANPEEYGYEIINEDGEYELWDDNGYNVETGDKKDILAAIEENGVAPTPGIYEVYLDIKDPLRIDWQGKNWDESPTEVVFEIINGDGDIVDYAYEEIEAKAMVKDEKGYSYEESEQEIYFGGINEAVKEARHMGVDGLIVDNIYDSGPAGNGQEGGTQYIVFEPTQVKSIYNPGLWGKSADIMKSGKGPTWYSPAEKAVRDLKQKKGTGKQMLAMIKKTPGVKKEELEWMGLDEYLGEMVGTVTKQQIMDFMKERGVGLNEFVADNFTVKEDRIEEIAAKLHKDFLDSTITAYENDGQELSEDDITDISNAIEWPYEKARGIAAREVETKFDEWTLPGGENDYNEFYITLPMLEGKGFEVPPAHKTGSKKANTQQVVRVRFNIREDRDGKSVLFIEEIQSDLHQEGRTEGYRGKTLHRRDFEVKEVKLKDSQLAIDAGRKGVQGVVDQWQAWGEDLTADSIVWEAYDQEGTWIGTNVKTKEGLEKLITEKLGKARVRNQKKAPDAPFKTSYTMLAIKRMIRYAAEEDIDKIAWISGEQTAARYDLSKKVDKIRWSKPFAHDEYVVEFIIDGSIEPSLSQRTTSDKLPGIVGKELAEKIVSGAENDMAGELEKEDLKVGGEWAKNLYNKSIPKEVGKFIKKYDGKVGELELGEEVGGFHGYRVEKVRGGWAVTLLGDDLVRNPVVILDTKELAEKELKAYIDEWAGTDDENVGKQLGFDITPKMKAQALGKGMPMFSKRKEDRTIRGTENLNASKDGQESSSSVLHGDAIIRSIMEQLAAASSPAVAKAFRGGEVNIAVKAYNRALEAASNSRLSANKKQAFAAKFFDKLPLNPRAKLHKLLARVSAAAKPETQQKRLDLLLQRAERELATYLRRELTEKIKGKVKPLAMKEGGIAEGRGAKFEKDLKYIRKIFKLFNRQEAIEAEFDRLDRARNKFQEAFDAAETETEMKSYQEELDQIDVQAGFLNTFGGLARKNALELAEAKKVLDLFLTDGRVAWREYQENLRKRAQVNSLMAANDISPKGKKGPESPTAKSNRETEQQSSTGNWLKEKKNAIMNTIQSWELALDKIVGDRSAGTLQSKLVKHFGSLAHSATRKYEELTMDTEDLLMDKAAEIWGVKTGWRLRRKLAKLDRVETGKVFTYTKGGKKEALAISPNQAAYWYQIWKGRGESEAIKKTFEKMGVTQKTMRQIEKLIGPELQTWADYLVYEFYQDFHGGVNDIYKQRYGVDLNKTLHYVPLKRELTGQQEDKEMESMLATSNTSTKKGGFHERVFTDKTFKKIGLNDVLFSHTDDMNHFRAWALPSQEINATFNNPEIRNLIIRHHGKAAMDQIKFFQKRFTMTSEEIMSGNIRWLDALRSGVVKSMVGGNPVVFLKQLTSFPAMAADIPTSDWLKYTASFVYNPLNIIKAAKTLGITGDSTMMKFRYRKGHSRDIREAKQRSGSAALSGSKRVSDYTMLLTAWGDKFAIIAGGWAVYKHHYAQYKKQGLSKKEAHAKAITKFEAAAERSQQSAQTKDMGTWQQGDSMKKALTVFMNSPAAYTRMIDAGIRNYGTDTLGASKRLFIFGVLMPVVFQAVTDGMLAGALDHDDDDEWLKDTAIRHSSAIVRAPFNGLPLARNFMEMAVNKVTGKSFFTTQYSPLAEVPKTLFLDLPGNAMKMKSGTKRISPEEYQVRTLMNLYVLFGYGTGFPSKPIAKIAKGISDATGVDIPLHKAEETKYPVRRALGFSKYALGEK